MQVGEVDKVFNKKIESRANIATKDTVIVVRSIKNGNSKIKTPREDKPRSGMGGKDLNRRFKSLISSLSLLTKER